MQASSNSPDAPDEHASAAAPGGWSPAAADAATHDADPFAARPEVYVGGAFAAGLVLAGLLRLIGR